jgi:hypothetical protein
MSSPLPTTPLQDDTKGLLSIQKSLHEKKQYIEHEVNKTGSAFTRFNKHYTTLVFIKSTLLSVYSIYNLCEELEQHELFAILLSLIMAILMLKKAKFATKAIEHKSHIKTKSMLKKAVAVTVVLGAVYFMWCMNFAYNFVGPQISARQEIQITKENIDFEIGPLIAQLPPVVPQNMEKMKYARIGGPGMHHGTPKPHGPPKQMRDGRFLQEIDAKSDYLSKKATFDAQIHEKYQVLYDLLHDLSMVLGLILIIIYFIFKTVLYFAHFIKFHRAVEKMEQVNRLIEHFQVQSVSSVGDEVETEDDHDEPMGEPETLVQPADEPIIHEESVPTMPVCHMPACHMPAYDTRIMQSSELPSYPCPKEQTDCSPGCLW